MGTPLRQRPVKLIASIIYRDTDRLEEAKRRLIALYGPIEGPPGSFDFSFTDYYQKEMGSDLKREIVCFKRLVNLDGIQRIKLRTNRIEDTFSSDGKRTVNIDPGYVTEAKLVLLTTKDYTHRVYMGERIFAESTLHFTDGSFRAWPWTYPDYSSGELIGYFNEVRDAYMRDAGKRREGRVVGAK